MASTVHEPDLFNDVEIMEIGDFSTESDENYVSVELLSENDDEDETDTVALDTIPFCPPKELLCTSAKLPTNKTKTDLPCPSELRCEQDGYATASLPQHRFLSDHQYLVGSSMHHIVPRKATSDQISIHVPHSSERFSVSYDMDIRTQDLFNKESNTIVSCASLVNPQNHRSLAAPGIEENPSVMDEYGEYGPCKIEIGETEVQSYSDEAYVGYEEITAYDDAPSSGEDEDDKIVLKALLHGMPRLTRATNDEVTSLENDHSYTSLGTSQPTENRETPAGESEAVVDENVVELLTLSRKLANERDVTSVGAKAITDQIERALKSFRKRQQNHPEAMEADHRTVREETQCVADMDSLSVVLSANCSERLENECNIPSSAGSVVTMTENVNDDSGTDTDCTAVRTKLHTSEGPDTGPDLDQLILLGDCFTKQCDEWLGKHSAASDDKSSEKSVKFARLLSVLETLKGQCSRVLSPRTGCMRNGTSMGMVEIAVQTDHCKASIEQEQRALNEKYKKTLLASASDSSPLTDSGGSEATASSDSDRKGDDMMNDFVRRRRMHKRAKEKRNKMRSTPHSAKEQRDGEELRRSGGLGRNQIYSDSSSKSDDEKRSPNANRTDPTEGEDNLLEGVLSGVDDIMLDVHDILPAGEDVVQDYLENEEVRSKRQERDKRRASEREEKDNSDVSSSGKNFKDMTESELEEYNEAQQDKEIDRLCNISCLSVDRNGPFIGPVSSAGNGNAASAKAKEALQKKKKEQSTMEDFLNEENRNDATLPPPALSDNSDGSEKEEADTEEQFLQKCNENMKFQLLNQLSSSDVNSDSDDAVPDISRDSDGDDNEKGDNDSDGSSGSVLDSFLKRLDRKHIERSERKGQSKANDGKDAMRKLESGGTAAASSTSEGNAVLSVVDPTVSSELPEKETGTGVGTEAGMFDDSLDEPVDSQKPQKVVEKAGKLELADPKDRSLFSRSALADGDDTPRAEKKPVVRKARPIKRQKRLDSFGEPVSSDSDVDADNSSADSDVELMHDSSQKRKRTRKSSPPLEPFDFSEPLGNAARKDSLSSSGGTTGARTEQPTPKPSTARTKGAAEASPVGSEASSTATQAKTQKSSTREDQDCISLSSDSDADTEVIAGELEETSRPPQDNKRKIRAMLTNDELAEETKKAQKEEEGRVARLRKKNEMLKKFLLTFRPRAGESELVLDYDSVQEEAICVHPDIVKLLKPHQVEGIKFMYDNTYGSVDALPKHPGSGCILAHCMGLGKTLQMIAILHTVMRYPHLMTRRVLVICPKSTVMNWKEEIIRWQGTIKTGHQMRVFCFADVCTQDDKISVLKKWFSCASPNCGVMLIGYEAFRALINYERRKRSVDLPRGGSKLERIKEYLLNPGADLVICDEGHQIKNKRSAISEAVSKIKTKRRIMLTGTPIQNNLKEYYCMVNFIKPSFLGSDKEFSNLYANPIKNGQCKDSDQRAIKIMKQRSYVLHNKLSKFVQRKEAAVLKEFLPEKYEYVLFVPLTPVQEKMYEMFLHMNEYTSSNETPGEPGRNKKFKLIADYTSLRKIWTHPKVLEKAWETAIQEKNRKDAARKTATPDSYDESPDDNNDIASGQLSVTNDWWRQFLETSDLESLFPSNKLWIMFEILKQSNERGEKCLIFSAFVAVLNVVEHFMAKIHRQSDEPQQSDAYAYSAFKGPWEPGKDYYRLDGKTHKSIRHKMITSFNDPRNTRTKCFLISAKAGGQGINLTGANRVIILDTSWNPSNDQQNIFRIFRLGQKKKCFVYRLLAMGTMEEKVYSRSVTKQALSFRVVDEQQVDRHYSYGELAELYTLTKVSEMTHETPILPADDVLALLLRIFPNKIFKYHEHDSLLENKPEQDLSEDDKKEAWAAYEREIQTNDNRSLISAWGSVSQAGLYGQQGPYSRVMDYYASFGYPGLAGPPPIGAGGDMYRTDFSYNRSLYNAYASAQQQFSMLSDSPYASMLGKPYGGYPVPNAGGLDYGSSLMNGQPAGAMGGLAGAAKQYDTAAVLANLFSSMYSPKSNPGSSGMPSNMGGAGAGSLPPPASSPLSAPPYNGVSSNAASAHFNAFKHMSDYNSLNSPLHMQQQPSPSVHSMASMAALAAQQHKPADAATGQPNSGSSAIAPGSGTMLSMLSEQAQMAAAAAAAAAASSFGSAGVSTSPFAPRTVPLLPPTIETQMRNFMGAAPKTRHPKTQSPKRQSPMPPQSPLAGPSTPRSTTGNGPASGGSSSSSSIATTSTRMTPIITSVVSMAPHASMALDAPYRSPSDLLVQEGAVVNRSTSDDRRDSHTPSGGDHGAPASSASTSISQLLANRNITSNLVPALGTVTNRGSAAKAPEPVRPLSSSSAARGNARRTPTPTAAQPRASPTVIPSDDDDDDEEDATNRIAPPHVIVRDVSATNGGGDGGKAKEAEKRAAGNNIGIVYRPDPKTTPPSAPPTTTIGIKDILKSAKSLTNLTQQPAKAKQQPSAQPAGLGGASARMAGASKPISQTPPPIISSPNARPFQAFVRANSSSTALSTPRRQSPSAAKLIPAMKNVVQHQQQPTPRLSPAPPPGSPVTVQQQAPKVIPFPSKGSAALVNAAQPHKQPPVGSPLSSAGVTFSAKPAVSSVPAMPADPLGAVTSKQQLASTVVTRPQPTPVGGNVTKTVPKSAATEGNQPQQQQPIKASPGLMSAGKLPSSVPSSGASVVTSPLSGAGITVTKSNVVVNAPSRPAAKPPIESRPITLSLTPLHTGGATFDTAAASKMVRKSAAPLLPKAAAQQSPATVASMSAAASPTSRSSPVERRPISVVQKPNVPTQPKAKPVPMLPHTGLVGANGVLNPVAIGARGGGLASTSIFLQQPQQAPIHKPNPVSVSAAPQAIVNRLAKGPTPLKMNAAASGVTVTAGPRLGLGNSASSVAAGPQAVPSASALSAFATSRARLQAGTAKTVIASSNVAKPGAAPGVVTTSSLTVAAAANAKPPLSYSFKHASKELVITKAIASPTIRQIQPSPGGPHIVVKSAAGTAGPVTTNAAKLSSSASAIPPTLAAGAPARQTVPLGMVRAPNPATIALPVGNFQQHGGSTNNVFIRKRKADATLLESFKTKTSSSNSIAELGSEPIVLGKRLKGDEPAATSVASILAATNRLGGGITITPKIVPAKGGPKDDVFEVVEIE